MKRCIKEEESSRSGLGKGLEQSQSWVWSGSETRNTAEAGLKAVAAPDCCCTYQGCLRMQTPAWMWVLVDLRLPRSPEDLPLPPANKQNLESTNLIMIIGVFSKTISKQFEVNICWAGDGWYELLKYGGILLYLLEEVQVLWWIHCLVHTVMIEETQTQMQEKN